MMSVGIGIGYQLSMTFWRTMEYSPQEYRPFPSSLVPLFQSESKCETFHMKMSSACSFIFMQIKVIFIRKVSQLDLAQGNSEMAY